MNILYAIQGTGNGHVSRAREVLPTLKKMANVDIFLSGGNSNIQLPFEINYTSKGLSFEYNKKGGLSYLKSFRKINFFDICKEIRDFPIEKYDLVINDFECISAYAAKNKNIPCISFSHQASLLSPNAPRPKGCNFLGDTILKNYAPTPSAVGLHFKPYDNFIYTPIIRKEIRQLNPVKLNHYTVYLPAVGTNEIIKLLSQIPHIRWEVFSRTNHFTQVEKNITIRPIQNDVFIQSLSTCQGLLTSAGFESPAEALYLGKKLFVIPIQGQYEQACNAEALSQLGIPISSFSDSEILIKLNDWINNEQKTTLNFPDITSSLLEKILFDNNRFQIQKSSN